MASIVTLTSAFFEASSTSSRVAFVLVCVESQPYRAKLYRRGVGQIRSKAKHFLDVDAFGMAIIHFNENKGIMIKRKIKIKTILAGYSVVGGPPSSCEAGLCRTGAERRLEIHSSARR